MFDGLGFADMVLIDPCAYMVSTYLDKFITWSLLWVNFNCQNDNLESPEKRTLIRIYLDQISLRACIWKVVLIINCGRKT